RVGGGGRVWGGGAERGGGSGDEPGVADVDSAPLAAAVGAAGESLQGGVHGSEVGLDSVQQAEVALPLEGVAGHVGDVLVHVGELAGVLPLRAAIGSGVEQQGI